jgi:histidinol dehydrogenase
LTSVLRIISASDERAVARLLDRRITADAALSRRVASIVDAVRRSGDAALRRYARQFDGFAGAIEMTPQEIRTGARATPADVRAAIVTAARHIRRVAERQVPHSSVIRVRSGVSIEHRVLPLDRVGCYVPGGRHPLPSSLLMTAIPARVAGVRDVIAVCPQPAPAVLAAALQAGVTRFFRVGGAHAIAALAYGTKTVPRVDKIVGPGNRYVAAAKNHVALDCAIDFQAGPTEVIIVSHSGRADWIAADLVAQAEHDPDARAILITTSRRLADSVAREAAARAPGAGPAARALARNGGIIVARDRRHAIALARRAAPEHLASDDEDMARQVGVAGTVFAGAYSAPAAGDYATGSNHVLPTGGAARLRGGLSAADFVRIVTIQRVTRSGLRALAPAVLALAEAEGLTAHAESVRVRLRESR